MKLTTLATVLLSILIPSLCQALDYEGFKVVSVKPDEKRGEVFEVDPDTGAMTPVTIGAPLRKDTEIEVHGEDIRVYANYKDVSDFEISSGFSAGDDPKVAQTLLKWLTDPFGARVKMQAKTRGEGSGTTHSCAKEEVQPSQNAKLTAKNQLFVSGHQMALAWHGPADNICWGGLGDKLKCEKISCEHFAIIDFDLFLPPEIFRVEIVNGSETISGYTFKLVKEDSLPLPDFLDAKSQWTDYQRISWLVWLLEQDDKRYSIYALSRLSELRYNLIANTVFNRLIDE